MHAIPRALSRSPDLGGFGPKPWILPDMGVRESGTPERPALHFDTVADFHAWLLEHHATSREVWTVLLKKGAQGLGMTYRDALREALRFGWIDSVEQRLDTDAVRLRWTPRQRDSHWSAANLALAAELSDTGQMYPAGAAAYARALADTDALRTRRQVESGRLPENYEALLQVDPAASQFFYEQAPASYRATCIHWVCSAKRQDTRDRRAAELIAACSEGRLIAPLASGPTPSWARHTRGSRST